MKQIFRVDDTNCGLILTINFYVELGVLVDNLKVEKGRLY